MSTPLSPLEQLEQQSAKAQPSQATSASNLSPLEQLEQMSAKQPTQQSDYLSKVNTGPFSPAGQAEKAMATGSNKDQAKEALRNTVDATGETLAGITGATGVGALVDSAAEAAPS